MQSGRLFAGDCTTGTQGVDSVAHRERDSADHGGGKAMSFGTRGRAGGGGEGTEPATEPRAGSPGKRTRTQDLVRRTDGRVPMGVEPETGSGDSSRIGALEETPCDVDGAGPDCVLTDRKRDQLRAEIGIRANAAADNWHAAISDERVAVLTKAPSGWGALWELGVVALTAGAGSAALKMLEWLNSLPVMLPARGHILLAQAMNSPTEIAVSVGTLTGARDRMKAAVTADPSRAPVSALLSELREYPGQWAHAIRNEVAPTLTDVRLQALCFMLDLSNHSVSIYQAHVHDLISRFEAQALAIGKALQPPGSSAGASVDHLETAVWLRAHGQQRLALCASLVEHEPYAAKPKLRYQRHVFVRWVDADMVSAATEVQRERFGEVPEVDAIDGPFLGADRPEVRRWLASISSASLWTDLTGGAVP